MSDLAKTQLPSTNSLVLERQGSVLKIWFNRPEAKNALNAEMTDELVNVLSWLKMTAVFALLCCVAKVASSAQVVILKALSPVCRQVMLLKWPRVTAPSVTL